MLSLTIRADRRENDAWKIWARARTEQQNSGGEPRRIKSNGTGGKMLGKWSECSPTDRTKETLSSLAPTVLKTKTSWSPTLAAIAPIQTNDWRRKKCSRRPMVWQPSWEPRGARSTPNTKMTSAINRERHKQANSFWWRFRLKILWKKCDKGS